jgi:thioredoxin-dependent peroxiredoxin
MATVQDFSIASSGGETFTLSAQRGKTVVLYFYPKDDTPGCTTEGQNFRDHIARFHKANVVVVGVSRDSVKSHDKFCEKYSFPFPLLADTEELLCTQFAVMKMKNMYGKQVRGVERSTFIIDKKGELIREWRGVKVPGHVDEVLAYVESLK